MMKRLQRLRRWFLSPFAKRRVWQTRKRWHLRQDGRVADGGMVRPLRRWAS